MSDELEGATYADVARMLGEAEARITELEAQAKSSIESWSAMLKAIAELNSVVNPDDEMNQADEDELLEEFDPWFALLEAKAHMEALKAQLAQATGRQGKADEWETVPVGTHGISETSDIHVEKLTYIGHESTRRILRITKYKLGKFKGRISLPADAYRLQRKRGAEQ